MIKETKKLDVDSKVDWVITPQVSDKIPLSKAIGFLEKNFKINMRNGYTFTENGITYTRWCGGFNSIKPLSSKELFEIVNEFNLKYGRMESISIWFIK